jgi:hypothetical protein
LSESRWNQLGPAPGAPSTGPSDLWLRKWTLSAGVPGGEMMILSTSEQTSTGEYADLRVQFEVTAADLNSGTPNHAIITVWNLADRTASQVIKEYTQVILQAGYQTGHYGIIFKGDVKQFKRGRQNALESYLTLYCADSILPTTYSTVNTTLPKGWTFDQLRDALIKSQQQWGAEVGHIDRKPSGGVVGPRPAVLYANSIDEVYAYSRAMQQSWTFQNGKITILNWDGYQPGDIIELNSATGMIEVPELTQDGLLVKSLLNPRVYIKCRVRLNNADITQYFAPGGGWLNPMTGNSLLGFPNVKQGTPAYAHAAADGVYCALVINHSGDTRGQPWYTLMTCLDVDPTVAQGDVSGMKDATNSASP